jgi:hypothetical protein
VPALRSRSIRDRPAESTPQGTLRLDPQSNFRLALLVAGLLALPLARAERMGAQSGEAKADASPAKRDADLRLVVEKCDAMAGEAKTCCVTAARTTSGKY